MNTAAPDFNSLLAATAAPLPAFIKADQLAASLRIYRYRPEQLATLLEALGDALHNEHYRHDGELSDLLHTKGGELADSASDLRAAAEAVVEACYCGKCDACVAARSDEHHDRKRDVEMMRTAV